MTSITRSSWWPKLNDGTREFLLQRAENIQHYSHWNYVAVFSTGRVKVGVTGDPGERFAYYLQEVRRHNLGDVTMSARGGEYSRLEVLAVERALCHEFASHRAIGGREWFLGGDALALEMEKRVLELQAIANAAGPLFRPRVKRTCITLASWRDGYEPAPIQHDEATLQ